MSLGIELYIDVDTGGEELHRVQLHFDSISHNFVDLWKDLGLYDDLYKSDGRMAGSLTDPLDQAIILVTNNSSMYKSSLPKDKSFGDDYDAAVTFLAALLSACKLHPNSLINVSL